MLSAVIVGSEPWRREAIQKAAVESGRILVSRMWDRYPFPYEMTLIVNTIEPDLALVDLTRFGEAVAFAREIATRHPATIQIGFSDKPDACPSEEAAEIEEILPSVPDAALLADVLDRAVHRRKGGVQDNLLAFVPAKAGSGTTTVLFNTAAALAGPLGKKVLVMECDLRSGAMSVLLNCAVEGSIQEALTSATDVDGLKLAQCVEAVGDVDFLLSNHKPLQPPPDWEQYFRLLDCARPKYDFILADLPELADGACADVMRRARWLFEVCTPEIPSLTMAKWRCEELTSAGIPRERIRVVVNRCHEHDLGRKDIEKFLGYPVFAAMPSDYPALCKATIDGGTVNSETPLGEAFLAFAGAVANEAVSAARKATLSDKLFRFARHGH